MYHIFSVLCNNTGTIAHSWEFEALKNMNSFVSLAFLKVRTVHDFYFG